MFRTKPRQLLRVPMGVFDEEKDPAFFLQYLSLAERRAILDRHTQITYHLLPEGVTAADMPSKLPFFEKTRVNDVAVVAEIVGASVVGWEHVCDDETGEPLPFDSNLLLTWIRDGGDVYAWFAAKLPDIFREFDALLQAQQDALEKN